MAPIRRVLIANRGEIAVRIARACKDSKIVSIAVYADPDREALHVKIADEAYALGGTTPGESYLVQEKLLEVAARAGADAVHPGYGFLAENASFAQAVIDAGLIWIGPSPEAIDSLGDKVKARHIAARANAPLVPGTSDPVENSDEVVAFAKKHGLPVAIKAVFGGGGRGMKVARTTQQIPELFDSATREAISAFGRGECFVERYLDKPRHVETQCLADSFGNVVVVSTRDCSLQRRHQKVIEESPSPAVTPGLRARLAEAAISAARAVGYRNAGTVEFLLAPDGQFFFLEMNTRLQVEHPVTEEAFGVDLVALQLAVAAGERLPADLPSVPRGHAMEARIYAEDPDAGFLPQTGKVLVYREPAGPGIRVDSGICEGMEVSVHYDPMLAKVIARGSSRDEARRRLVAALSEMVVLGVQTNISYLRRVLETPEFRAGKADTGFLERTPLTLSGEPDDAVFQAAARVLSSASASPSAAASRAGFPDPLASGGFRMAS